MSSNVKSNNQIHNAMIGFVILMVALLVVLMTGCAIQPAKGNVDAKPSLAPAVETPEPAETGVVAFGAARTYQDGVSISVSAPTPYAVGEFATGLVEGQQPMVFTLVLTNESDEVLNPSVLSLVSSGGVEAASIFDVGNPNGETVGGPLTPILPGQTIQWLEAYSIADPATITFQTSPSFAYDPAIFTNIAQ